jgi:hypothetical protein
VVVGEHKVELGGGADDWFMLISGFLSVNEVERRSTGCAVVTGAEGVGETGTSNSACGA